MCFNIWIQCFSYLGILFYIHQSSCAYADVGLRRFKRNGNEHEENGSEHEDHTTILDAMFVGYDPTASPTHDTDTPTRVEVSLRVISLDSISDETMEYVLDARLTLVWNDKRLVTEECKGGEDCDDHFDMKSRIQNMWTPDLYFVNSKSVKAHDQPFPNSMIYLVASGTVHYSKRMTLTMRCAMGLKLYPLDTQKCPLLICPYSLVKEELSLSWYEQGVILLESEHEGRNKFDLILPIDTAHVFVPYNGQDISGEFSCVNATFRLSRYSGYQLAFNYTVTFLLVIASWITFWLPLTAIPARVTLGVTILLTLLTSANHARSSLPPISYVTAIDVWIGGCCLLVFGALLQLPLAVFISNLTATDKKKELFKKTEKARSTKISYVRSRQKMSLAEEIAKLQSNPNCLDKQCRFIFPCLYLMFNIAYWSYYIPQSKKI